MKSLGIDIGTTTISTAVVENGAVIDSETWENGCFLPPSLPGERAQNIGAIEETVTRALDAVLLRHPDLKRIGVTGQMHGILYVDRRGNALSPLYTWQDARGDAPCEKSADGASWSEYLSRETGLSVPTGYGFVTHAYNLAHGLVPPETAYLCTIGDYIAMKLCGGAAPVMDASNAASLGFFSLKTRMFDYAALRQVGIDPMVAPPIALTPLIGRFRNTVGVSVAIGDNQASFLASVKDRNAEMLVNVGTGSQFSVFSERCMQAEGLETRPMPGGGWLLVGASLCGGRAYALLAEFFAQTARMMGSEPSDVYGAMERRLRSSPRPESIPDVLPLFEGTRQDSSRTAAITGLTAENFTPLHLIWGMMEGMAQELAQMYRAYLAAGGLPRQLTGSGGGLRCNPFLCDCFSRAFGTPITLIEGREEAAAGAALFAAQ